ncbi:Putative exodeoxyribonuclease 8, PDDEXK-like domain containing protein [uncultured Caudovirales phage]|uniref:Exodeoxyribonuclease 8, PDDEXK-like domain containing protein n=1 Tax=uncultured Caudovirales phage TaxID=2100421 RepID=A0A6J7X276_9CAUD|nr:Putative exodeoxyribonuclease 8, PDDEXK-like domain containing protein [uncultured Caudovirales phage]CAB5224901.1 Putative exodeoxyribonuclease 8, PDDEXK-like domain containing protein [uncultured Caudovirales phage]
MAESEYIKIMENEEYHDSEGLSASGIKLFLECPRKYFYRYVLKIKPKPTPAMLEGSAFHEFVLEPEKFNSVNWKQEKLEQFKAMKESLYSIPTVSKMLSDGFAEGSLFWKDEGSGVTLKTRPDYLSLKQKAVFDLKTSSDASKEGFSRSIHNFGYHIQAAMAIDGLKTCFGEEFDVINLVVEKSEPYCVGAYYIDLPSIALGRKLYQHGIKLYLKCLNNNFWPSYTYQDESENKCEIETIGVPFWVEKNFLAGEI